MIRVWHLLVVLLLIIVAGGGLLWRHLALRQEARDEKAAEEAALAKKLSTPAGYAELRLHSDLALDYNAKREVFIQGTVANRGKRDLQQVIVRLQPLAEDGKPKGRGKRLRLGPLAADQTRTIKHVIYTFEQEELEPDPDRGGIMVYELPAARVEFDRVFFDVSG